MTDPLLPLLQCPRCRRSALVAVDDQYECAPCRVRFPRLDGIPWLYPDPESAVAEWRNRSMLYLEEFAAEARRAAADLESLPSGGLTAARVRRLAEAYADHGRRVAALLAPLRLEPGAMPHATQLAFGTEVPLSQDLHSYHANVHRDWAWGEGENAASYEAVAAALGDVGGNVLVLGAGAGRLAYDLHCAARSGTTVGVDINPLLLAVARRAAAGDPVELYEFPIAPVEATDAAVLRRLCAPAPARDGLVFVAADAWRAPFAAQSFDAVITPWFVDIVEVEFPELAAHVNRLLRPGGRWVNFGSLAFPWRRPALRWTRDEILALVAASGFDVRSSADLRLPYLQSPASRHARLETVAVFAADKARRGPREAEPPAPPAWLADTSLPVPRTAALDLQGTAARIHAVLLALVDGRRSVDEIVEVVSGQGLLGPAEARVAVRALLERMESAAATGGPRVM